MTGIRVCHKVKMYLKCYKKSTREGKIMYGTIWALLPPVVAIVLALITKEVYSSLFIGIVTGALIYTGFSPIATLDTVINEGFINSVADAWNIGIFMFLILLGTMVALMNKAGGSAAFGEWAKKHVKTRAGALLSTFLLGVLIFVDDYFNCLTVGSVMMPVTDGHKISRAKLAYIIDATAAPICMIAPISSWAAAVSGMVDEGVYSGIELFVRAIPYNYYSLLTIVFVVGMALMGFDYGPMAKHERNAREKGDLFTEGERVANADNAPKGSTRGKVYDLLIPVIVLIVCCVIGMIYVGGFFEGVGFIDAFRATDASVGLPWGSLIALLFAIVYYMCRRLVSFKEAMNCLTQGFIAMDPDLCRYSEDHDRTVRCGCLCGRPDAGSIHGAYQYASGHHFPGSMFPGLCFRYQLGNLRYSDPYRYRRIYRSHDRSYRTRSRASDHHRCVCMSGRCCYG